MEVIVKIDDNRNNKINLIKKYEIIIKMQYIKLNKLIIGVR